MQMDPITPDEARRRAQPHDLSTGEYLVHVILQKINLETMHPYHKGEYVFEAGTERADKAAAILASKGWKVRRDTGIRLYDEPCRCRGTIGMCNCVTKEYPYDNWIVEW